MQQEGSSPVPDHFKPASLGSKVLNLSEQQQVLLLLQSALNRAESENGILDKALQLARDENDHIRNTLSWRITAPLRKAKTLVRLSAYLFGQGIQSLLERKEIGSTLRDLALLLSEEWKQGFSGVELVARQKGISRSQSYNEWWRKYGNDKQEDLEAASIAISSFSRLPLISVVMPCYNPKPEWLSVSVESVKSQIYPHWELCIADDASTDESVVQLLRSAAASSNAKIKVEFKTINEHISATSNCALNLANGEWVVLLDHDDQLHPLALYYLVELINARPCVQLVYSDEDKMDDHGKLFDPYFKPSWNPELIRAQNFFSHLGCYRRDLVLSVGGFRLGYEGSQDYDLLLRCWDATGDDAIAHIPRVLYHWRAHSHSTASATSAKPYALDAAQRALRDHLVRRSIDATVETNDHGYHLVRYALPAAPPLVSIIVPSKDSADLLSSCLVSVIEQTSYPSWEMLIVDNGSTQADALDLLNDFAKDPRVKIIRVPGEFNYSALNNLAAKHARGEWLCLLNNDIQVLDGSWLSAMVGCALQPGVLAVGAKLLFPNHTIQHIGVVLGLGGVAGHCHAKLPATSGGYFCRPFVCHDVDAATAACLLVNANAYQQVSGLDDEYLKVAFNDVDLCLKLRELGGRILLTPSLSLIHHESASRGSDSSPEKKRRFRWEVAVMHHRWGDRLLEDRTYNPNLSLAKDFQLADPPRQRSFR